MNQQMQHHRHEMGGTGNPKEGSVGSVEAVRREVRYAAEDQVDAAMALPPYREVASLVLQEVTPVPQATPSVPDTMPYMGPIPSVAIKGEG